MMISRIGRAMRRAAGIAAALAAIALLSACATPGQVDERDHDLGTYQLYVPDSYTAEESNVVVVVHGTPGRNQDVDGLARQFIDRWTDFADDTGTVIVAPAFDQQNYASCDCGGYGGYRGLHGREAGADEFLHAILDEVALALAPTQERRFYLYGHSAGGQFAGRYAVTHPERLLGVVLSAPGRHAFPDNVRWHYGMDAVSWDAVWPNGERTRIQVTPDPDGWLQAATLPVNIVIGEDDTNAQPCQPAHCEAGESETTRIAINRRWMEQMKALADDAGQYGRISMEVVPNTGHNSAALTDDAQTVLRHLMAGRAAVPDVVGLHRNRAQEVLERSPFQARVDQVLSSRPRGEVVRQLPEAGSWKATGSPVVVSVSLGVDQPDRTTVPDVTGIDVDRASAAIREAGFTPVVVFVDSEAPFKQVVNQQPAGGERVAPGTEVHIAASKGPGDIP